MGACMLISTEYNPFRLSLTQKKPVRLTVVLSNEDKQAKMVTFELAMDDALSLDKAGYRSSDIQRFDSFPGRETKKLYFDLWPKGYAQKGELSVNVRVFEHHESYTYVKREYSKNIPLTVTEE
jgi:hypothetical protein